MILNVQELIDMLKTIEDKSKPVYFEDDCYGILSVRKVIEDERWKDEPVVFKN